MVCIALHVFFSPNASHRRPKKLIAEPYQNWNDRMDDLLRHADCDYHIISYTRIDIVMNDESTSGVKRNREVLKSLIKYVQFCGMQGSGLRGHR